MKKLILLSICLFAMLNTKGQQLSYEYEIVQKSQHDNQTLTIDLSSKIEGIYLLTILIGETWYSCKIIKQ